VMVCGSGALRFIEADEAAEARREAVDTVIRRTLRLDKGTPR